jgi:hypothetical protein
MSKTHRVIPPQAVPGKVPGETDRTTPWTISLCGRDERQFLQVVWAGSLPAHLSFGGD